MARRDGKEDCASVRASEGETLKTYSIRRRGRFWEVLDPMRALVCITVYKRGAQEVVRRLRD
jgi:hypothetical protein